MRLPPQMQTIVDLLSLSARSEHFEVVHGMLNPVRGRSGLGIRGVRNPALIACYVDAFERLYQVITGPVFDYPPPNTDKSGRTMVYVFHVPDRFADGSPFTTHDLDGVPYIGLPCRSADPTLQAALHRSASEAVHEATHVFNWTVRPPGSGIRDGDWYWFNDASAVFMERHVLPGNPDAIRFCLNWADRPEVPVDDLGARYQAGMFVGYLASRFKPGIVARVWKESTRGDTPLAALNNIFAKDFARHHSVNPDLLPIFGDYCLDGYFLWDHTSPAFAPDVFVRFGERALSDYHLLSPGGQAQVSGIVDHLACRYYRFDLETPVTCVRFEMVAPAKTSGPRLDVRVAEVTRSRERGTTVPLTWDGQSGTQPGAELTGLNPRNIDHLVLAVANCGVRRAKVDPTIPHDDGLQYTITVSAC